MRNIDWAYTYNHLDDMAMTGGIEAARQRGMTQPFRILDDDGVVYFTGMMTRSLVQSYYILDPLDYARDSWGCTEMQIKSAGVWTVV